MSLTAAVYLEDLTVGDEFRSGEHRLDETQIVDFARQFDPQPFHTDAEAARHTFFQGLAASGWHTAAITMKLLVQSVPLGGGLIGAGGTVEWPRPTRPGDALRVVCKVLEIKPSRSRPDRGMVTVETLTLNQRDETCQRLVTQMVVLRRPG
ncbi:MaoC family dehydratase [Ideonella oryzae]|uniref:MaoC family dehydratase n=1 Tax=Ideonella oryzae TaxID=2937441 RepID=A0ABT1BHB5_9BURK|nr:MaoC family dehydratase [Ideonella oryzae]MCO5975334.1 MaoC family dehydratase [Ideonella oryzae]